jgi:hypothetical protein
VKLLRSAVGRWVAFPAGCSLFEDGRAPLPLHRRHHPRFRVHKDIAFFFFFPPGSDMATLSPIEQLQHTRWRHPVVKASRASRAVEGAAERTEHGRKEQHLETM